MKLVSRLEVIVALSALLIGFGATSAQASGPSVTWQCKLIQLEDAQGPFVYFDPNAEVSWNGRTLYFTMWTWASRDTRKSQAGKTYGTMKGGSSGFNRGSLDLTHKFYFQNETEYKKVQLLLRDSSGKTDSRTCIWKGPVANGW